MAEVCDKNSGIDNFSLAAIQSEIIIKKIALLIYHINMKADCPLIRIYEM